MGAASEQRREALLPEAPEARQPHRPRRVQDSGGMVGLAPGRPQDPQRRVVLEVYLSQDPKRAHRPQASLGKLMEKYGREVVFVTDGEKWYPWAAESLGARWVWP